MPGMPQAAGERAPAVLLRRMLDPGEGEAVGPVNGKPLVDPNCLCGKAHPCPDHGQAEHTQLHLF